MCKYFDILHVSLSLSLNLSLRFTLSLTPRLISAFRDKLEGHNSYYYPTIGRKIVAKYRAAAVEALGEDFFSAEYVVFILAARPSLTASFLQHFSFMQPYTPRLLTSFIPLKQH